MLVGAYAFLQKSVFAPKAQTYYAVFPDAQGITSGAKVLLAGVDVGKVEAVGLENGTQAKLTLALNQGVQLPQGTEAVIPTALIGIGDRQIELIPPKKVEGQLPEGATLKGSLRSALQAFAPDSESTIKALETTLAKANQTLDAATQLMSDQTLKKNMNQLMAQGALTAEQFGRLAKRLDSTLAANQATIAGMLRNGQSVSKDLAKVSRTFASYVEKGTLQGNVDKLFTKMNQALDNGNEIIAQFKIMASDPTMQANLKEIIANTKIMTSKGTEIAENAKLLTGKGIEFGDEATQLMKKANLMADDARELLQTLKKKLGMGGDGASLVPAIGKIEASADIFRERSPNRWRTELNAKIPVGKHNVHLGLWDAFESNKITAQLGQKLGKNGELRYGVYASKPGVGVELPLTSSLRLRGDVFGVNKPRLDLRARLDLNKNVHGWIGLERIFEKNSPSVGIGIRP